MKKGGIKTRNDHNTTSEERERRSKGSASRKIRFWPVHPIFILIIAPFVPSSFYLNRGYTVWYNLTTIVYLLTNIEPLRRFLIVQGVGICAGWYAAMANDVISHGRFAHILYMNMPPSMKYEMVDASGNVFYTYNSLLYMGISHMLDTLLHPGIAYLLYKAHRKAGGTLDDVLSWKILGATQAMSRIWSIVHTKHNTGRIGAWYFGYDIYDLHDLDCWMPAYVAEIVMFTIMIGFKLLKNRNIKKQEVKGKTN
jgi:hypothetical protein